MDMGKLVTDILEPPRNHITTTHTQV